MPEQACEQLDSLMEDVETSFKSWRQSSTTTPKIDSSFRKLVTASTTVWASISNSISFHPSLLIQLNTSLKLRSSAIDGSVIFPHVHTSPLPPSLQNLATAPQPTFLWLSNTAASMLHFSTPFHGFTHFSSK